jgi:hypothetical protein
LENLKFARKHRSCTLRCLPPPHNLSSILCWLDRGRYKIDTMQVDAREFDQRKRKFREFLNENNEHYMGKIRDSIDNDKFRFTVNINDIRNRESDWAQNIVSNPREYLLALTQAAEDAVKGNLQYEKKLGTRKLQAGFEGSLGANSVSPRGLTSSHINSLVGVEGFVTKCSKVRPKMMKSVQYCPATGKYTPREYRDSLSMEVGIETKEGQANMPTGSAMAQVTRSPLATCRVFPFPLLLSSLLTYFVSYKFIALVSLLISLNCRVF